MRRLLIALIGIVLLLLVAGPWVLYEVGLSNVVGRPTLPTVTPIAAAEAEAVWRKLGEKGPIAVERLSPHWYLRAFCTNGTLAPGQRVAWLVARNHNQEHLKNKRMIWWHLSGAALTIWLTRNWSSDQLVAKAHEIFRLDQLAADCVLKRLQVQLGAT